MPQRWSPVRLPCRLRSARCPDTLALRVRAVRRTLGDGDDLRSLWVRGPGLPGGRVALIYIRGLADVKTLQQYVTEPLGQVGARAPASPDGRVEALRRTLAGVNPQVARNRQAMVQAALAGDALLLLPTATEPWILQAAGGKERGVEEPSTEAGMRGPRESFTENLTVNVALVRRRLRDPRLAVQERLIGTLTRTRVDLLFLRGLASQRLVAEVCTRLEAISVPALRDSSELGELLCRGYRTPFPLVSNTERPDRLVSALLEGRVVLLVDGSPWAFALPCRLLNFFFAADDYYMRPPIAILMRLARLAAWIGIVLLPALYVALEAYNPDVLRVEMMLTIDAARSGVPLNVLFELGFLVVMVELVQEAAIRLPEKVGGATTLVGALIIGDAVARARIVSNIIIVIAAMGTIGSLTFPDREAAAAWRISSILLVVGAAILGIYGALLGLLVLTFHLASLEPFGECYLYPLAPLDIRALLADGLLRRPRWQEPRQGGRT